MNTFLMSRRGLSNKAQPIIDYASKYLTLEALEAGNFTFTIPSQLSPSHGTINLKSISYSVDGGKTWVRTDNVANKEVVITTPTVQAGGKVLWKGEGTTITPNATYYSHFSSDGLFNVYGNVMSLLYGDNFTTVNSFSAVYALAYLFYQSKVVSAEHLMLQATILTASCYRSMFHGCSNLVIGPDLLATNPAGTCYYGMYRNCVKLRYIKMMLLTLATNSLLYWVDWTNGVTNGTFVKNRNAEWDITGRDGVPSGWTIEYADN